MWRRSWTSALVCPFVVLLAGCNSNPQAVPLASEVSPVLSSTDLGCYGSPATPPDDLSIYFDSVALPTSDHYPTALQTGAQSEYFRDSAGRLFAKTGLYFKPGKAFEVIVPDELRDRLSIGWDSRSWHVVVGECAGIPSTWVALPGGYWVADPMCAELIVRSSGSDERVKVGLGAPCPGQAPPPQPSDV